MRSGPNRLLPLLGRYGTVLLAALIVYYVIRDPVLLAVSDYSLHRQLKDEFLRENGVKISQAVGEDGAPTFESPGTSPKTPVADGKDSQLEQEEQSPIREQPPPSFPAKRYKPMPPKFPPIEDHFPWLTHAHTPPKVLDNNLPPWPHVPEKTPLFIGFTRNWPLLLQCVSSYIAAGWPASDIYVVENTGAFSANRRRELSLQNPFFLNVTALNILGVNVISTPTLLSFSQLQNFYLHTALQRGWEYIFWSHQDVIVFSDEEVRKNDRDHDWDNDPYATIYERAVGLLRYLNSPDMPPWATHFFAYDHLTLVNRDAYLKVGAWDTLIPYYASDCDMYLRLHWEGYWQPQSEAGLVLDVSSVLSDIGALFRIPGSHARFDGDPVFADGPDLDLEGSEGEGTNPEMQRELDMRPWVDKHGESWAHLVDVAKRMQDLKWEDQGIYRNKWQTRQSGGHGEPFYRNPEGFEIGVETMIDAGRQVFADKWGHRGCDLLQAGIESGDAWRVERDWDIREGPGNVGGNWGADWMVVDDDEEET